MGIIAKIPFLNKTILCSNCEDTMLYDYMKVIEKKDLKYLIKSGPLPKKKNLLKNWNAINKEFEDLRGENNMIKKFDLISYRQELIEKVHFGVALLDIIQTQVALHIIAKETFDSLVVELESWGFYLEKEIPLEEAIEIVKSEIDALQLTIDSLSEELNPTDDPEEEVEISNAIFNFYSMLLLYEKILKKERINPKTTSLMEFAVMEKDIKKTQEEYKKNNRSNN